MLLEAKNIEKRYVGHLALNDVNITIPENSIYGILGPNGAGKTTFIRIVNHIMEPDKGHIFFNGKRMQPDDVKHVGYLPEERGLYKKMKVGEQVLYLSQLKNLSKAEAKKRARHWFEKFEIQAWWNKPVEELSKGMQQKVQFIITILHEPKLLIFDEPFSGFDPLNASLIKNEILELHQKGATVILSTHNMQSVEELCDHISLINNSQVVLDGEVTEIKERYKQHIYVLETQGNVNIPESELFQIISKEQNKDILTVRIKAAKGNVNNELIKFIMPYCPVLSFREELPDMEEVFIKTVRQHE